MAKKKKAAKKTAKKKVAKKTAKKKIAKGGLNQRLRKKIAARKAAEKTLRKKIAARKAAEKTPTPHGLHEKKLAIMKEHPIMPCSILTSDRAGNAFAHTHADEIVAIYRNACIKRRLVLRMVKCETETVDFGSHKGRSANCVFEIRDVDSNETETFAGAGDGDNNVWSITSAQTVAFKEALLLYFCASWPQPSEFISVAKDYMEKLPKDRFKEAIAEITPLKIKTDVEAMAEMEDFWKTVVPAF